MERPKEGAAIDKFGHHFQEFNIELSIYILYNMRMPAHHVHIASANDSYFGNCWNCMNLSGDACIIE